MKHLIQLSQLSPHVETIYFGGALGGDTEALKAALHFRSTAPSDNGRNKNLVVVVPDTVTSQPFSTRVWTQQASEVIELRNPITKEDGFASYGIRDQYLVDSATSLVAFFSGNYSTGTGKTVRMAENKGIRVTKVPISGVLD